MYTFKNTQQLIDQAKKDRACSDGITWCQGKELNKILETIPKKYRLWCLVRGYFQFAEHCDWSKLDGYDWVFYLDASPNSPNTAIGVN